MGLPWISFLNYKYSALDPPCSMRCRGNWTNSLNNSSHSTRPSRPFVVSANWKHVCFHFLLFQTKRHTSFYILGLAIKIRILDGLFSRTLLKRMVQSAFFPGENFKTKLIEITLGTFSWYPPGEAQVSSTLRCECPSRRINLCIENFWETGPKHSPVHNPALNRPVWATAEGGPRWKS